MVKSQRIKPFQALMGRKRPALLTSSALQRVSNSSYRIKIRTILRQFLSLTWINSKIQRC